MNDRVASTANSPTMDWAISYGPLLVALIILAILVTAYLFSRLRLVHGQQAVVVERLGVPQPRPLQQGLRFVMPLSSVKERVDLRQKQVEHKSDVKTGDDAFINIAWILRFSVQNTNEAILAYVYKVEEPVNQLVFRVENELRQIISGMTLNELYGQKDSIARQIIADQAINALETGLRIDGVVIEQPLPPKAVQEAMNNKLAAMAKQQAAVAEAEAERLRRVGMAMAESQSKQLQGEGIAKQRMAIARGFKESVDLLREGMPEASMSDITTLLLQANQNDMVTTASSTGKATVIFVPLSMGGIGQITSLLPSDVRAHVAAPDVPVTSITNRN